MSDAGDQIRVVDNPAEERYEVYVGDALAGFSAYELKPATGTIVFLHTEVDPAFEGQGVGSRLAAGALADVRARGLSAEVLCPFIADYVKRHPDAVDLGM